MRKLGEEKASALLRKWGIPVAEGKIAKTKREALSAAKKIGYPVALKIDSPDIVHKTEHGCVVTNISGDDALERAYDRIMENAKNAKKDAKIRGVIVQEMIGSSARELIIGAKNDPNFGPVIMFGLGGIFVEVLKDVSFRIIPITREDAHDMMDEIKGSRILGHVRGMEPVNRNKLAECLLAVSRMVEKEENIEEIDLNPVFADKNGVKVADIRVMVK